MKLFKKINKGLILTAIVLVILITYIVTLEIQRNKEKGVIKEACEAYIEFESKYTLLPKEYQSFTNKISQEKLEEYKKEVSKELKKLMVDDENVYKLQKSIVEGKIDEQTESFIINTSKNCKLVKISKYEFENDQVTVTIDDLVETEYILADNSDGINENVNKKTDKTEDTITLKRENGKWKVVFAEVGNTISGMF